MYFRVPMAMESGNVKLNWNCSFPKNITFLKGVKSRKTCNYNIHQKCIFAGELSMQCLTIIIQGLLRSRKLI